MLILIVTWAPAFADVGVEGSTAPVTSPNVTEALVLPLVLTETPVVLPLRNTAGKVLPLVNAITLIRYGPPEGTPMEKVLEPIPADMSWLPRSVPEIEPPSTTATNRVAAGGILPTERLSCWADAMRGSNSIRPHSSVHQQRLRFIILPSISVRTSILRSLTDSIRLPPGCLADQMFRVLRSLLYRH
jgi:hypothetical protein